MGDRLVMLNHGVIQQIGKPHEVFENPVNLWVSKILGHPQINLVECKVRQEGDAVQLRSSDGFVSVNVPDHLRAPLLKQNIDDFTLGMRPMHLHPVTNGADAPAAANTFDGLVYVFERLGTRGVLTATVGQQKIDLLTPIEMDFGFDEAVRIAVEVDNVLIFNSKTQQNILFAE